VVPPSEHAPQFGEGALAVHGRGLLRGGGGKAAEVLHAQLREKEIELEHQERRLGELQAALTRREADLNAYARKLQQGAAGAGTEGGAERPSGEREEIDPTARRLQFWSR